MRLAFDGGRLTSDAGVLMLAGIGRRLGVAERLARCIADPRAPERVHHTAGQAGPHLPVSSSIQRSCRLFGSRSIGPDSGPRSRYQAWTLGEARRFH